MSTPRRRKNGTPEKRSPGRPRSEASRRAILRASYRLLRKHPIEEVTVQMLAAEAGVSSATIYRWWPTKEAVLMEGFLESVTPQRDKPTNGAPIHELRDSVLQAARFLADADGRLLRRLMAAAHDDDELRRELLERFHTPRRVAARRMIERAIDARELRAGLDPEEVLDTLLGPLYFRALVGHAPVNEAFAADLFDQTLEGLRRRRSGRAQST